MHLLQETTKSTHRSGQDQMSLWRSVRLLRRSRAVPLFSMRQMKRKVCSHLMSYGVAAEHVVKAVVKLCLASFYCVEAPNLFTNIVDGNPIYWSIVWQMYIKPDKEGGQKQSHVLLKGQWSVQQFFPFHSTTIDPLFIWDWIFHAVDRFTHWAIQQKTFTHPRVTQCELHTLLLGK